MTPEQFSYWLQGFAELHPEPPTALQWQSIREHLATVFTKVTPSVKKLQPLDWESLEGTTVSFPFGRAPTIEC